MTTYREVFQDFFSSFYNRFGAVPTPVPAFQEGYVAFYDANNILLPEINWPPSWHYITYSFVRPDFDDFTIITVNVYHRVSNRPGEFRLVDDILEQIAEAIPLGGVTLPVGDKGGCILYRSNPFMPYLDVPEKQDVMRGMCRIVVKNFTP